MKKLLKIFLILPILALFSLFGVACDDNSLKAISLVSVSSLSESNTTINQDEENGYYILRKGDAYKIDIKCDPSNYTIEDLSWATSDTYVVTINNNVVMANNEGYATISISYKNSEGNAIKLSFDVRVSSDLPKITFNTLNAKDFVYNGKDLLKGNQHLFVEQDSDGTKYKYTFYSYNDNSQVTYNEYGTLKVTHAGKYRVSCSDQQGQITVTKDIIVTPKPVQITAGNYIYVYGKGIIDNSTDGDGYWPNSVVINSASESQKQNITVIENNEEKIIGSYYEKIKNGINMSSNVGASNPVYVSGITFNEEVNKNDYQIKTVNGNLNIIPRTIIIIPNEQKGNDNNGLEYGQLANLNDYKIYEYSTDENGKWVGLNSNYRLADYYLSSQIVDYKRNFTVESATYYLSATKDNEQVAGQETNKNSAGCLNVGDYFYKLNIRANTSNINIANNTSIASESYLKNLIKIKQRDVVVSPTPNQSKIFLENDPENILYTIDTGSFISGDNISKFLEINYNNENVDLGNGNCKAPVNEYPYIVVNTNGNYNITIKDVEDTNTLTFEVKPLQINIEVSNLESIYKLPNIQRDSTLLQSISYYGREVAKNEIGEESKNEGKYKIISGILSNGEINYAYMNYRTSINSLKIAGKQIVENNSIVTSDPTDQSAKLFNNIYIKKATNYDLTGEFEIVYRQFSNDGKYTDAFLYNFSYNLNLNKLDDSILASYESYEVSSSIKLDTEVSNCSSSSNIALLNLTKKNIKIYPNENAPSMTKVYDATPNMPDNFGLVNNEENLVSYTYDTLTADGKNIGDVLKDFNSTTKSIFDKNIAEQGNVGQYKIKLDPNLETKDEYAYLNFVLDDSKDYFFTITPRSLLITPEANQTKIYGTEDPENFSYDIQNLPVGVDSTKLTKEGYLTRVVGEDVGSYQFKLGTLSFGNNYYLNLNIFSKPFTITQRELIITPVEYTTTYGDDYPQSIDYRIEEVISEKSSSYKTPTKSEFIGSFSLGVYNSSTSSYTLAIKTGNYYLAGEYAILQGGFSCPDNFKIRPFSQVGYKKFIVNPRQVVINFIPQAKDGSEIDESVANANYEISTNLVDTPVTYSLNNWNFQRKSNVCTVKDPEILFEKNGQNISNSYQVILGKNIVYTINTQVIDLVLRNKDDQTKNIKTTTYNGLVQNNNFVLLSQTSGFAVSNKTTYQENYILPGGETLAPKNSGYYNAYISLTDTDKIVITHNVEEIIVFKKDATTDDYKAYTEKENGTGDLIEEEISSYVLNLSNIAYLDIRKADISYNLEDVSFSSPMHYGDDVTPQLANNIFKGVTFLDELGNETVESITLKTFKQTESYSVNYNISQTSLNELANLGVSERKAVVLTIENDPGKDQNGKENINNYNSLTLTAYLQIDPQEVNYDDALFDIQSSSGGSLVYSGQNVKTNFVLKNEGSQVSQKKYGYHIVYEFKRLTYDYFGTNRSLTTKILCYNINDSQDEYKSMEEMNISSCSIIPLVVSGTYVVYNNTITIPYNDNQEEVPINAGVYMCFATCIIDPNYTFKYDENGENDYSNGNSITFATIFEIERNSSVSINPWKSEFKYTTEFDFNNPETLPFEYDVTPSRLKQKIQYVIVDDNLKKEKDVKISVNSYQIRLLIDDENYYYYVDKDFDVTKLEAKIVYPSISSYVYTSEEITSYLSNIGAVLKDKDDKTVGTVYYYRDTASFSFTKYKIVNRERKLISPDNEDENYRYILDVGDYLLHIEYGKNDNVISTEESDQIKNQNYFGEADYYFSVVEAPYKGTLTFLDSSITYNPNATPIFLYNAIIGNSSVFSIDMLNTNYTLEMYYNPFGDNIEEEGEDGTNNSLKLIYDGLDTFGTDEDFKDFFRVGQRKIRIIIKFKDGKTRSTWTEAWLDIKPYTITDKEFLKDNNHPYTYTGYKYYRELTLLTGATIENSNDKWSGNLVPGVNGAAWQKTLIYNNQTYHVSYEDVNRDFPNLYEKMGYVVRDKLENVIFVLAYSYYNEASALERSVPISPGNYIIKYNIRLGEEYKTSTTLTNFPEKAFTIQKVNTLYVYIKNKEIKIPYTGNNVNLTNLKDSYSFVVVNQGNLEVTNMNYTLVKSSSNKKASYSEEYGVCLQVTFNVENVKDIGSYTMSIALLDSTNYNLSTYFSNVYIINSNNSSEICKVYEDGATGEMTSYRDENNNCKIICEGTLTIALEVDINNYTDVINFSQNLFQIGSGENAYLKTAPGVSVLSILDGFRVYLVNIDMDNERVLQVGNSLSAGTYFLKFAGTYSYNESYIKLVVTNET